MNEDFGSCLQECPKPSKTVNVVPNCYGYKCSIPQRHCNKIVECKAKTVTDNLDICIIVRIIFYFNGYLKKKRF